MKSYQEFCEHYEYALDDKKSKKLYEKYKLNLEFFQSMMVKKSSDDNDNNDDSMIKFG